MIRIAALALPPATVEHMFPVWRTVLLFLQCLHIVSPVRFEPNWTSIDARPIPSWYDEAKFGIFMHWGVFAVPAFRSEWFWWYWQGPTPDPALVDFMKQNYRPGFTYAEFAQQFTAEYFDPDAFRSLVESSGARYFVFTSKHVEGFTNWPSNASWNWNSVDTGPHRDIVGELKNAFSKSSVHFGLYYCLYEWFHPIYLYDKGKNYTTNNYVKQVSLPQMYDLVNRYQPDIFWSDGEYEAYDSYWESKEFIAWLYNDSPIKHKVAVNDRWGIGTMGHHGGYLTFSDLYDPGHLIARKWEMCYMMDVESWGFRRNMKAEDVHTVNNLISKLARAISCNGNFLLNVGPNQHGIINPIFQDRLKKLGLWVKVNEEAIFGTKPWIYQNDENTVWYTSRLRDNSTYRQHRVFNPQVKTNTIVYAFVLAWPANNELKLSHIKINDKARVKMLGLGGVLPMKKISGATVIDLSPIPWITLPSFDGWVLRFEYLDTENRNPIEALQRDGILNEFGLPKNVPTASRDPSRRAIDSEIVGDFEEMQFL